MDEKYVHDDTSAASEVEQKPVQKNRQIISVKSSYSQQFSYEDQTTNESIESDGIIELFSNNRLVLMKSNHQIKELQTILWDKKTSRTDFIFNADRLIRLVIEEGLNQLPFEECSVVTHSGAIYIGCSFAKGICGVSIVRSGEAMEKGLRECCRSVRIGKILVTKEDEGNDRTIIYNRFPPDMDERKVLLMYPLLATGGNVMVGVEALLDYGVDENNIYILSLFATPNSIKTLFKKYPGVLLLTTDINNQVPVHFGEKYYGTDF